MTGRDRDLQHHVDRAATELARRIRANPSPADPDAFARAYLEDLYAEGWRPVARPAAIPQHGRGDPPSADWKTLKAKIKGEPQ